MLTTSKTYIGRRWGSSCTLLVKEVSNESLREAIIEFNALRHVPGSYFSDASAFPFLKTLLTEKHIHTFALS